MGGLITPLFDTYATLAAGDARRTSVLANTNELNFASQRSRADASDALSRGGIAAGQQRMRGSALLAKQRVAFANSGVDMNVGTPVDVAASSALFNEFDALTIENNAAREALGHKRTSHKYKLQTAQLQRDESAAQTADSIRLAKNAASFYGSAASMGMGG